MKELRLIPIIILLLLSFIHKAIQAQGMPHSNSESGINLDSTIVVTNLDSLNEVVVTASKTIQRGDKTTVFIDKQLRRGASNTGQLLGNLPGFYCDNSSNDLTYNGSHNIMILIDGMEKPVGYIKELHHMRFYKIEITDHPQGKYAEYDVLIELYTKPNYEAYEGIAMLHNVNYLSRENGNDKIPGFNQGQGSFTYTKNNWNIVTSYAFLFDQYSYKNWYEKYYYLNNLKERNITNSDGSCNNIGFHRNHNIYTAIDYQLNKNHSFSFSYNYNIDSSNKYEPNTLVRTDLFSLKEDTLSVWKKSLEKTASSSVALFYRGHSGEWRYTSDFNYVNRASKPYSNRTESSGYTLINDYLDRMNYTRFRADVNRSFFENKLYFSVGYVNTWKDYMRRSHATHQELNSNNFLRNKLWMQFSYNLSDQTQMGLGGSAEYVHTKSDTLTDNQMVYSFNATAFHRFSRKNWARINYWCNIDYPDLEQSSSYGSFVDSLNWIGGNPLLHSSVSHNVRLWIDLWSCFNVQTGYIYSPNRFCYLAEEREGALSNGGYGKYVAQTTVNSSYKEWWASISVTKRFWRDFLFKADVKYRNIRSYYGEYKNADNDLSGTTSLRYFYEKQHLTVKITYTSENNLSVLPQRKSAYNNDFSMLYIGKSFFNQKLDIGVQYFLPICFSTGTEWTIENSPILNYYSHYNQYNRNKNRLDFTIIYRFNGGKSVRQYNREMANEK